MVIRGICDCVCVCVCVRLNSKRKTTQAVNTNISTRILHGKTSACIDRA